MGPHMAFLFGFDGAGEADRQQILFLYLRFFGRLAAPISSRKYYSAVNGLESLLML